MVSMVRRYRGDSRNHSDDKRRTLLASGATKIYIRKLNFE